MAGALPHPVLVLPERERPRHERAPEAVRAERALERALRVEVDPLELGRAQVRPHAVRHVVEVQRPAVLVDEHEVVGLGVPRLLPPLQRGRDSGRQLPPARAVGLVLVERDRLVLQVDVAELQLLGLAAPHAFAVQEAPQQPIGERHVLACEQSGVLSRVEDREALARAGRGEPALRQRVALDVPQELGEVQDAVQQHGVLPPRRLRELGLQPRHHRLAVRTRDFVDRLVAEHRID
ncbi:MAG: hypothetical protein QM756_26510 [Polyangiaceae bacterium]